MPDEDEAARDVAKVMSVVGPLLKSYQHRHEELAGLLTASQASAASATAGARELSQDHLQTFGRLEEGCAGLRQELDVAAATAAAAAEAANSLSGTNIPEQRGSGGSSLSRAEVATQRRLAAVSEADTLAARYRSLVQRRRRMRSALRVLEVSEKGRAALEAGAETRGQLGARAEETMKAIECLRGLLGEYRDGSSDGARSPSPAAAASAAAGRGDGDKHDGAGGGGPTTTADGELARVTQGRLEWLTQRLRAQLSSELAAALRQADPLAAAPVKGAGTGNGTRGGGGRGRGFGGRRGTTEGRAGSRQGPEWFLSFLLRALEAYRPLLLLLALPPPAEGAPELEAREAGRGGGSVDPLAYFARGLALLARRRLRAQLGEAAADESLLSHTVEEALAFDRCLDREAGYAECPARFPHQTWPRCVEVFAQGEQRFERWMESDAKAAKAKLAEAAASPGAWRAVDWKNGPRSSTPVTPSAVALCRLFSDVTERYRPLRDPLKQLRFAKHVQEPVLRSASGGGEATKGAPGGGGGAGGVTSAADGLTATWAAALEAAMVGPGQEDGGDKSPIGRWRGYCLALASCAYVCAVLRESEDDMLFADMAETAAAAWAAAREVSGEGRAARPSSSLGSVGNVVGAAVGGVSHAVTELATTAETATAGVARAVGVQGSIIGPTHAISAALTSLKGAARRVRKGASGNRNNGTDSGSGGAGTAASMIVEEEGDGGVRDDGSDEGVAGEVEVGDGGFVGDATTATEKREAPAAADTVVGGEFEGSVFGEEARRYEVMLEAMLRGAVESCRDGFLWRTRSYLRAWDRGIAVVVRASSAAASSALPGGSSSSSSSSSAAEPSGRLCEGVELLETALGVAEGCLPPGQFQQFWTALASELDLTLVKQIVARRVEMSQDEGLQLLADLKVLMGPFDSLARRRPERHFPALAEAAVLLSLEKDGRTHARKGMNTTKRTLHIEGSLFAQSQLRSLSSGLDAHGGGVEEAVRGGGWDGWREEGGALSPEGTQMRDMLENVGVRRMGPAEASILLDKRLKGDRLAVLGYLSAAAGENGGGGGGGGSHPAAAGFAEAGVVGVAPRGGDGRPDGTFTGPGVGGGGVGGSREGAVPREAVSSFG
ncbi:hypothetical protein Esi_0000_0496 [Ectocarpus siliculosus]|uniref:Uncharacterized protein n=1 Tax=Ectocarpus siliculosus TaxID=2880 RepID=D8LBJ7_ECTSI|nr:hypothetical protein Esi_0000_0496 [Ectocarpus siliculosus]|eukprot:CBN76706.1 hypothetical protein Esi_0000_0496 [Ectocarpus siliculosus]